MTNYKQQALDAYKQEQARETSERRQVASELVDTLFGQGASANIDWDAIPDQDITSQFHYLRATFFELDGMKFFFQYLNSAHLSVTSNVRYTNFPSFKPSEYLPRGLLHLVVWTNCGWESSCVTRPEHVGALLAKYSTERQPDVLERAIQFIYDFVWSVMPW